MTNTEDALMSAMVWFVGALAATAAEPGDYQQHVKPVLQMRCFACHGALKQAAGLRLDTAELLRKGGDSGSAVMPGDPEASLIVQRVMATEESVRMPPEGEPLKPGEIAALQAWIRAGAAGPSGEQPERDPRDHWAFRSPLRPALPVVGAPRWTKNPVDAFIAAKHQEHGLAAQPRSDKRTWLRRVTLDLTGLPPAVADLDAFLADESPTAELTVVNRLLDSPQYGERWGRHWMDIWRYSDWWGLGAEVRNSQKHIWHFRDWIIESLNADHGYDQMLREMLAADELHPNDLGKLRASGFLARQYFKFNRTSWLDETIEHTSKAMLGLTFNCAKCHDHKYDPFSQQEYYQLRAFFEPYQIRTDAVPGVIDFEQDGIPRAFDCNLTAPTFLHVRGDDRNPDKTRTILPVLPAFLQIGDYPVQPVTLPQEAVQPGLRPFVEEAHLQQAEARIQAAKTALDVARRQSNEAEAAARIAEATAPPDEPADALTALEEPAILRDDFSSARPDVWEPRAGEWAYVDKKLQQTQVGNRRAAYRFKREVPADFEARLTYIPVGGEMWRSVGISFDVTETSDVLAYLSAAAVGQKVQVAVGRSGNYTYPPEAGQGRPIEFRKPHELLLRVRGTQVNVHVEGKFSIAYRLPGARQPGALELITFDAAAEFLSFELRRLPVNTLLMESMPTPMVPQAAALPVDQARVNLRLAEQALRTEELQPASIRARAAADRARSRMPPPENLPALLAAAVKAERLVAAAKSEVDVSKAELEFLKAIPEKKAELNQKLTATRAARDAANTLANQPGDTYTSLPGSLKTLESNLENEESRRKPFPETSTGRRTALANWITDPKHPLTARVCVNHLWARHFGRGLVPTVFDFGRKGTPPTHPELLDWLAVELIEHQWSMKHIHRLIVMSEAYRMSSSRSGASPHTLKLDPDNTFLWRRNPVRMEAQLVRDGLLALAGELDLTRGGPSIPVSDETSRRRSLYYVHSHNEHQKFLSMFDDASVLECYRRAESVVPQQALALENSPLASAMAGKIAGRIVAGQSDVTDAEFLRRAFLTVLGTEPGSAESAAVLEAMTQWQAVAKTAGRPDPVAFARTQLVQALLNHNDFVTIR